MSERIKQLEQFIAEDPLDPFNFYALALEYEKFNEHKALNYFSYLIKNHKDYLPTYYQLAKLYDRIGQKENAIKFFQEGMKIALGYNDLKTHRELKSGLEEVVED